MKCKKGRCRNVAEIGGLCYTHRLNKEAATEVTTAEADVSVPALPPAAVEFEPNQAESIQAETIFSLV